MVQVVVLNANGDSRTLKTSAIGTAATGAAVAKAFRKTTPASLIGTYTWGGKRVQIWGWSAGKAGTENKHELPPPHDESLQFGDMLATLEGGKDFTVDDWNVFYDSAYGGFEDADSEGEEEEEENDEEEVDDVEASDADSVEEEEESEDGDADEEIESEAEEEEDEEVDDGMDDDDGGGSKRRAPRRRTLAAPEYRRIDMGLRSQIKMPAQPSKRAPKWHTAPELAEEEYDM